ncbi:MAG: ABC transporter ATP-binding protein, partial [Rhodospirillaceae bacterium]|nr:ABC transporter ATP-binding protein [Rhodospirillaceae bacterium]
MSSEPEQVPPVPARLDDAVVNARDLAKHYTLYPSPMHRLLHVFWPGRAYPRFEALNGVSLTVRRGETVGVIGPNGAGKSTLLQLITGTIAASSGEVAVRGRVAALLELGAGFEPDFTGRENIMLNGTILGLSPRQLRERMAAIIAFSELEEFIDRQVRTYSSGMFMRLAFSVAAHVDADVLIIDEALAVGDARFTQKCMRFLHDFKRRGSILFVSHDLGAVAALCDRAIWLDHGTVRAQGSAVLVCEQYVAALFEHKPMSTPPQPATTATQAPVADAVVVFDRATPPAGFEVGITSCSPFNSTASSFGIGGARIVDGGLTAPDAETRLDQVREGDAVDLRVVVEATDTIAQPIVGFYIKDRLGQLLLGDNSYWYDAPQVPVAAGGRLVVRFRLRWPALAR